MKSLHDRIVDILIDLTDVTGWPNTNEAEGAFRHAALQLEALVGVEAADRAQLELTANRPDRCQEAL